jgi:membrane associated rhomboid family serine protease
MNQQLQIMPLTKVIKILVVINAVVWFVGSVILEQYFLTEPKITLWFGLTPFSVIKEFYLWQPLTYFFIHDTSPFHIIFNLLLLWWLGGELEQVWGSRFFTLYYFVCGIGAGFLYSFFALGASIMTSRLDMLVTPVIGASAAVFGLMVAYGLVFGERVVYFMFVIPMKAKFFVLILAAIELVMVLNNGLGGQGKVANLAHLGGLIVGFIFLKVWPFINNSGQGGQTGKKKRSKKLRLVVDNTDFNGDEKPKVWH